MLAIIYNVTITVSHTWPHFYFDSINRQNCLCCIVVIYLLFGPHSTFAMYVYVDIRICVLLSLPFLLSIRLNILASGSVLKLNRLLCSEIPHTQSSFLVDGGKGEQGAFAIDGSRQCICNRWKLAKKAHMNSNAGW